MKGFRVAVVAPATPLGQRLRETLEARAFPIAELRFFEGADASERRLTEFEGEVLITEPVDSDLFPRLDVLFFTDLADKAHVEAAVREGVLTFLFEDNGTGPVVALGVNEKALSKGARLVRSPRPASMLLGTALCALAQKFEIQTACATVALPAIELGKEGLEELQQQTIGVLSFKSPPTRVFGQRLAFNLTLPSTSIGETITSREAAEIAGLPSPVAVSLLRAPVFTAYAASLWVAISGAPHEEAVRAALRTSKRLHLHESETATKPAPSPLSVANLDKIQVARVRPDAGGFWMWLAADMSAVDPAVQSVRLAEKLLAIPVRRK